MTDVSRERPDQIERDIEARRDDLAATLDALQDRASPRVLAAGVGHALKDEGADVLDAAFRVARRNPVAVAMIAAGVAWLAFGPDTASSQRPRRRNAAGARPPQPAGHVAGNRPRGPVPGGTSHSPRSPAASGRSDRAPARLTPAPAER